MVVAMYVVTVSLIVFIAIGLMLTVGAFISARRSYKPEGMVAKGYPVRERIRRYVGPVTPDMPLFNPPVRVGIEFLCAVMGFPGLGWMVSGYIFIGLVLMSIVPAFVWAFYPAYATISGAWLQSPFYIFRYLPLMGVLSAGSLAAYHIIEFKKRGAGSRELDE